MCSPLAAISPAAALFKSKPRLATAMVSPVAAAMGLGKKKKSTQRYGDGTTADGGMS